MTMATDKDVLLVTSGGRTGTSFFADYLDEVVDDSFSVHEPDVWHGFSRADSWRAVRWFGPYHVIAGKFLRRTGMRCVGERYLTGDWSEDRTVDAIVRQRRRFYNSRSAALVIESNTQWFGLLPLLPRILPSYRVLALVRDPKDWVRSYVNFGGHHDDRDRVARFGLPRLSPEMTGGPWADRWQEMDVFERICWDWQFIATRLLEAAEEDDRVHLVRFEDLFLAERPAGRLEEILTTVTDFGHTRYGFSVPDGLFERKVNVSRPARMGHWDEWPTERKRFLVEMCGPLMERLGYLVEERSEPDRGPASSAELGGGEVGGG